MPSKPAIYRPTCRTPPPDHRPSASARGYGRRWEAFRLRVLADVAGDEFPEGGPLCRDCLDEGRFVEATQVDHKRAHRGDQALMWAADNLRALCHSCHSKKTARCDRHSRS